MNIQLEEYKNRIQWGTLQLPFLYLLFHSFLFFSFYKSSSVLHIPQILLFPSFLLHSFLNFLFILLLLYVSLIIFLYFFISTLLPYYYQILKNLLVVAMMCYNRSPEITYISSMKNVDTTRTTQTTLSASSSTRL